ncbi:LeoA/HP0731 family dynamin-like GTPase [Campylobacter lanienae]|uniref:LeoA/HP0731 family dynamin-like GTPase n=1 Tax=Campylobacter lanienae TaxID=75658 RepID=UPI000BB43EB3|nr:LeoA/HP0731 family dynamin-like GTPase [Campylobacter lanienae]
MNTTLNEFKNKKEQASKILNDLAVFLARGEEQGISIDESLKKKIADATSNIENQKLKVALIGGFSEGKTSIAAAWLEKIKDDMKISHEESSDAVAIYHLDDIDLVDTPGLFGFKEKNISNGDIEAYKNITKKYVSEADLVLYVMNSINPIKESHKDDLEWLFKTLNLLPRTIFILSKFDEVADMESDEEYEKHFEIKKNNVLLRLKELLNLSDDELYRISIVAVSANPDDEGIEYWLKNPDEFKKLSHIQTLQESTAKKIKESGGVENIANETKKSIIKDVLNKQLPVAKQANEKISKEIIKLTNSSNVLQKQMDRLRPEISDARVHLREFINTYFKGLLRKLKDTGLETISDFVVFEIGDKGINIDTTIQNAFDKRVMAVSTSLRKLQTDLDFEMNSFAKMAITYGQQGIKWLTSSNIINATNIKATRDVIRSGAKMIGVDVGLKFKPWGAVNLAKGLNAGLAALGLAFELWDSYQKAQKEQEFQKAKADMEEKLNNQQREIMDSLNDEGVFIEKYFPQYLELQKSIKMIENTKREFEARKIEFEKWVQEGEIIDAEFEEIN